MKKKWISAVLVMTLLAGVCNVAMAADETGATANSLKSHGTIEYQEGNDKVVISADDLYMLAGRLDRLRLEITEQLETMHTFFTAGDGIALETDQPVSVTHTRPSGADAVDPLSINLTTLVQGIAASQSVSPDVTVYGYPSGTKLYQCPDGSLTTDGSVKGAEEIYVEEASAENLSAGMVAWVKGKPILGTGGDNKSFYDQGKAVSGNVGKIKVTDLKNGKTDTTTYLVTESVKGAFIFLYTRDNEISGALSFEDQSGGSVECQKICDNSNIQDGVGTLYYIPELNQGTTIKTQGYNAYLYTFDSKCLNKACTVTPDGTYLATEDMYDVILMHAENGGKLTSLPTPEFTSADGNVVAFKKLSDHSMRKSSSDDTNRYNLLYMYYVPVIKAGTLIEGLYTESVIVY